MYKLVKSVRYRGQETSTHDCCDGMLVCGDAVFVKETKQKQKDGVANFPAKNREELQ